MFLKLASLGLISFIFISLNTEKAKSDSLSQDSVSYQDAISIEDAFKHKESIINAGPLYETPGNLHNTADSLVEMPPYLSYSNEPLRVIRNNEVHELVSGSSIKPGDIIETCARHFALIVFPPRGNLILFPSSQLIYSEDTQSLILKDAEIHFENNGQLINDIRHHTKANSPVSKANSPVSNIPEKLHCFEHVVSHSGPTHYPVSFAVNCRGETGMILSSKIASVKWNCARVDCYIEENSGILVQAASIKHANTTLPDSPDFKNITVIENDSNFDEMILIPGQSILEWSPVAMADHYLVHLYETSGESLKHHLLIMRSHTNHHKIDQLSEGSYAFRVMAIDYHGVSGSWSDVLYFRINESLNGS